MLGRRNPLRTWSLNKPQCAMSDTILIFPLWYKLQLHPRYPSRSWCKRISHISTTRYIRLVCVYDRRRGGTMWEAEASAGTLYPYTIWLNCQANSLNPLPLSTTQAESARLGLWVALHRLYRKNHLMQSTIYVYMYLMLCGNHLLSYSTYGRDLPDH